MYLCQCAWEGGTRYRDLIRRPAGDTMRASTARVSVVQQDRGVDRAQARRTRLSLPYSGSRASAPRAGSRSACRRRAAQRILRSGGTEGADRGVIETGDASSEKESRGRVPSVGADRIAGSTTLAWGAERYRARALVARRSRLPRRKGIDDSARAGSTVSSHHGLDVQAVGALPPKVQIDTAGADQLH